MSEAGEKAGGAKAAPKTYAGGCHCGKVRYEVTAAVEDGMTCNCSICAMKAHVLTFVSPAQFKLLSGEGSLSDYQFNKKVIHHLFCSNCGVSSFGRGTGPDGNEMYAVNLRCLDGFDLTSLPVQTFDGKSL
jgi:hypothetical protein